MSKRIQLRRGTTAENNAFTGAVGEVTVDTDKNTVVVHDGVTAGGTPLAIVSEVPSLVPQATATVQGKVELATQVEVNAGVDSVRAVTPSTLKTTIPIQTKSALNASGNAPIYACRAWVNFNGTGTVAIRASGNVSSITDNGTGDYTINFTTAMPDANYAVTGFATYPTNTFPVNTFGFGNDYSQTSSGSVQVRTANQSSGAMLDPSYVNVIIHR